jgi:hypothetical protein
MVVVIVTYQHLKQVEGLGWQIGTFDGVQFGPSHLMPNVFRRTFMISAPFFLLYK